jgi:hypothetical protein
MDARLSPAKDQTPFSPWGTRLVIVVLAVALVVLTVPNGVWTGPIERDASVLLYIGQHLLRGGTPYQTFIYFHPPGRLLVGLLWALGEQLSGLSIVQVARVYNVAAGGGLLVAVYALGKELTRRQIGGLLAAAVLPGLGTLHTLISGPNVKVTTTLLIALGLWMAQRRRWLWAAALTTLAAATWWLAGVTLIAVGLAAILQREHPHREVLLRVALGAGLVIGLFCISLALVGVLGDVYRQTVAATVRYMLRDSLGTAGTQSVSVLRDGLPLVLGRKGLLALVAGFGLVVTLVTRGLSKAFRAPEVSVLLLSAPLMVAVLASDFPPGVADLVTLVPMLAVFGAQVPTFALDKVGGMSPGRLRPALEVAVLGVVICSSVAYGVWSAPRENEPVTSLAQQQDQADQLVSLLEPGQSVQSVGNLWFHVLSGHDNATPIVQFGRKANHAAKLMDIRNKDWVRELRALEPVVVMFQSNLPTPARISKWLDEDYVLVGTLNGQKLYVYEDHPEIEMVIQSWVEG